MKKYIIPEDTINKIFDILSVLVLFMPTLKNDVETLKNEIKSYEFKG